MSDSGAHGSPPTLILVVLGMHRAGTSAVTGALSRLGFSLGGALVPAAEDNPLGYFENATAVDINEGLLLALGRGWDDLRPLPEGWTQSPAADEARGRILDWLRDEASSDSKIVLKDPRFCQTFPLWREVFEAEGAALQVVLAHRDLAEIVASLVKRDGLPTRHALLLALRHILTAERASRGLLRTVSNYDALLQAPREELSRRLVSLGHAMPAAPELDAAAASFDSTQRHHRDPTLPEGCKGLEAACAAVAQAGQTSSRPEPFSDGLLDSVVQACLIEAAALQPFADRFNASRRASRRLVSNIRRLDAALAAAEALSASRLEAVRASDGRLKQMDAALAARTGQLEQSRDEATQLEAALSHATVLALERLGVIESLDGALGEVQQLALERLDAIESLDARLIVALRDVGTARALIAHQADALAKTDAALAALQASWSWRLGRPFRAIAAQFRKTPP